MIELVNYLYLDYLSIKILKNNQTDHSIFIKIIKSVLLVHFNCFHPLFSPCSVRQKLF
jgi:hypothetical protein